MFCAHLFVCVCVFQLCAHLLAHPHLFFFCSLAITHVFHTQLVPGYRREIQEPMDLGTVNTRLASNTYRIPAQVGVSVSIGDVCVCVCKHM